jgi:hypothetical protein
MRQNASTHPHDSAGGTPPSIRTELRHRPHLVTATRRRLFAAFAVTATAATLGGLSVAGASTPGPAPHAGVRATSRLGASAPAAHHREHARLSGLLRRHVAGAAASAAPTAIPRSWTDAALHLSLAKLTEAPPKAQRRFRGALDGPRLHIGRPSGAPSDGVSPATWLALRECESGDDYAADTGNGYYGAYQFSAGTWWSIGYSGLPSEAAPAMQDAAAQRLLAVQGWGAWPVCSARIGM